MCIRDRYKHIPFYIRVNEHDLRPVGLFYNNSYDPSLIHI